MRFESRKQEASVFLETQRKAGSRLAILGAGHLACAFINFFGIGGMLEFVVDDNPHKRGMLMPKSRLKIKESAKLAEEGINLCLLSVNPRNEEKVMARNSQFVADGGRYLSIFNESSHSLFKKIHEQE